MGNALFGWPIYSDPNTLFAPSFAGGSWLATADTALANLQDRRMSKVARSTDAKLQSTRFAFDLKTARRVGVVAIPSHTLSRAAKVRVLAQPGTLLFDYEAGDDLTALGATFTRGSTGTYVDSSGVRRIAPINEVRDSHFISGLRHLLLEPQRTNLIIQSSAISIANGWIGINADSVNTPGQADAMGGTGAVLSSGSTSINGIYRNLPGATFATDGVKAISVDVKPGVGGAGPNLTIYDFAATTFRGAVQVTWTNGVPSGTPSSGAVLLPFEKLSNGWWRARFTVSGVIAANTSGLLLYCDSGSIGGSSYFGCAQVEDAISPSSYIVTAATTMTRVVDSLQIPTSGFTTQPLTMYESHVDLGSQLFATITAPSYVTLGNWATAGGLSLSSYADSAATEAGTQYNGTTQLFAGGAPAAVVYGDTVETRLLYTGGTVALGVSRNSGAEAMGTASASQAAPLGFSGNYVRINDRGAGGAAVGIAAYRAVRIAAGVQSLATMRAAVYDSGWLDVWPAVFPAGSLPADDPRMVDGKFSAEDAVGFNIGFVHIPPAAITFRYGSVQISDENNVAAYVDLGRLMVCGAYQPSLNMIYGAKLGLTTESTRVVTDGGAASYNEKPTARVQAFSMESLPEDELLVNLFDMMRRVGITKQFFYVHDPADTYHMHRRSFACVMRELSALEYPSFKRGTQPIAVIEDF